MVSKKERMFFKWVVKKETNVFEMGSKKKRMFFEIRSKKNCDIEKGNVCNIKRVILYRVFTKNGTVSKINNKFISHLTRAKLTPSAAATVQSFLCINHNPSMCAPWVTRHTSTR
jgi:hypothetical protein